MPPKRKAEAEAGAEDDDDDDEDDDDDDDEEEDRTPVSHEIVLKDHTKVSPVPVWKMGWMWDLLPLFALVCVCDLRR
jgi:hypothetical protein